MGIETINDVTKVSVPFELISIDIKTIARSLGYTDGVMPDHFEELVNNVIALLPEKCKIQAGYSVIDVRRIEGRNDGFEIGGKFVQTQGIIASQFKKADRVAIFVCTIGDEMENWSKQLASEGDVPYSYVVNTVASEAVEQAADVLHDALGEQMKLQNLNITNRYSPGYCNWSVAEQHILFSFLPENFCGITLTDSALMLPIKSVSGIIGIGRQVKKMNYICDTCGVKDCTYRIILTAKEERKKRNANSGL